MSDFVPFPPPPPVEGLYLVGFRLDPVSPGPEFYTVFALEGENERPITRGGRVVFFGTPQHAKSAAAHADNVAGLSFPHSQDAVNGHAGEPPLEMLVDVAQALYIANSQPSDPEGTLMDVIACFDDLVRAAQLNVPAEYMGVLSALAERLSENPEFAPFIEENGIDRERIEDALIWCVGAVTVKAKWYSE